MPISRDLYYVRTCASAKATIPIPKAKPAIPIAAPVAILAMDKKGTGYTGGMSFRGQINAIDEENGTKGV